MVVAVEERRGGRMEERGMRKVKDRGNNRSRWRIERRNEAGLRPEESAASLAAAHVRGILLHLFWKADLSGSFLLKDRNGSDSDDGASFDQLPQAASVAPPTSGGPPSK